MRNAGRIASSLLTLLVGSGAGAAEPSTEIDCVQDQPRSAREAGSTVHGVLAPCPDASPARLDKAESAAPASAKEPRLGVAGESEEARFEDPNGEPIRFGPNQQPQFTPGQRRLFDRDFQAGLMLYARTREGRAMIGKYGSGDEIRIRFRLEPGGADVLGSTSPATGNLVALANGSGPLAFAITINSALDGIDYKGSTPLDVPYPATTPVLRALQIGAEMLHVDYFVEGHPLGTHHSNPEFQTRWRTFARELGCPGFPHHD